MRRGDVVVVALQGDYGKPRPALVVQSNAFPEHPSVTLLPITSELVDTPLFRLRIQPGADNGLRTPSQVMVDKAATLPRHKINQIIGWLGPKDMQQVDRCLAAFLGLGDS